MAGPPEEAESPPAALAPPAALLSADWDPSMIMDEIAELRGEYRVQVESSQPSPRIQFSFASALVASSRYSDIDEGIFLLKELLDVGFRRNDCLHLLALAYIKMGNYVRAKEMLDIWIHLDPQSGMAKLMHSLVSASS